MERFPLFNYEVKVQKPSQFVAGHVHDEVIGVRCPACGAVGSEIEHGGSRKCGCGLVLTVWGASLHLGSKKAE